MGLFGRASSISIALSPGDATPGTDIHATVTADGVVDKVSSAIADWGYVNVYRYAWTDTSEKETDDWVSVQRADLSVVDGRFEGATSVFRVPSWAPASSPDLARWECRVAVDRSGRDAGAEGVFTVRVPPPTAVDSPFERLDGDATTIDLVLDRPAWRAGDTITGHVSFTAGREFPPADIVVYLGRVRTSHPLTKRPAAPAAVNLDAIPLEKKHVLKIGTTVLPFVIPIDKTLVPSGETVHTTLEWFVYTRVMYKGFSTGMDKARRRIAIYNA